MSVEFYERDGATRVRLTAGGHGGGATGVVDILATDEHKAEHASAYGLFLAQRAPVVEPPVEPEPEPEPEPAPPVEPEASA